MLWTYLALLGGLVCAGVGGELFVRGTVGLAQAARLSPELTVAVSSAIAGEPEISFGNVLGANVVNVALILGAALMLAPMIVPREILRRDFPVALVIPVATAAVLADGTVSRVDALVLLGGFGIWLLAVLHEVRRQRSVAGEILGDANPARATVEGLIGFVLLVAAGKLIVFGATGVAQAFGLSEFVIGATVVAVGTTVPELVTAIIARLRGHDEVGLGTVLGSNIFNGLFIVGIAASIAPIRVSFGAAAPSLLLGLATVALCYPQRHGRIGRWRGGILLVLYVGYLAVLLQPT
jgi:cation:H+ antiporter